MSNHLKCLIDIVVLIIVYMIVLYKKWKAKGNDILIVNTLMYIYLCLVLYVTLMPILASLPFLFNHPYTPMNLLPFNDYFAGRGDTIQQIVLNVIMMMPFGFLMPILKKQTFFSCTVRTIVFSVCIELLQPLIHGFRSADITDVITNTTGGILGYLLYRLFRPIVNAILRRLKSSSAERSGQNVH